MTIALTASTSWDDYTGTTNGTVRRRTSKNGRSGSVTVEITSAFLSSGPDVSNLSYTCSVAEMSDATGCSGSVTASDASMPTMGTDGYTADSFSVVQRLQNLPSYTLGLQVGGRLRHD